ncbi:FAD-binding protein, partial [Corallococcus soli]
MEAGVVTPLAARVARLPGLDVKPGEPLAPLISVRVGGPAEALVRPRSADALVDLLRFARDEGVPVTVLGGGANTLVGDGGVPGITLKLPADVF